MSLEQFLLAKGISAVMFFNSYFLITSTEHSKLVFDNFSYFNLNVGSLLQERTLEIEYIRAVAPRKEEKPSLHDDWVSAVDGSSPR